MDKILEKIDRDAAADDAKLQAEEEACQKVFLASEAPRLNYQRAVQARRNKADQHRAKRDAREAELRATFAPVLEPLRDGIFEQLEKARRYDKRDGAEVDHDRVKVLRGLLGECDSAHLNFDTPAAARAAIEAKIPRGPYGDESDNEPGRPKKLDRGGPILVGS